MSNSLLNQKAVKDLIRANKKRPSEVFLTLLNDFIRTKVVAACQIHDGKLKTLSAEVAGMVGITGGRR